MPLYILGRRLKKLHRKSRPFEQALSRKEVIRHQEGAGKCLKDRISHQATVVRTAPTIMQVRIQNDPCPNLEGQLSLLEDFTNVHHLLKNMFQLRNQSILFGGRIKYFLPNWEMLTTDKEVLNIVKGWEIPLLVKPT